MNQIIDLMLNWFTCQPCLSTNNAAQTRNETPIISPRTDFSSQHNSNPPSVVTMQPSQTSQDSVGNAESKLDACKPEKEVKSNLKRKSRSNKNTITTINKPKKRYKKDRPPPPIPQNTANNFVNPSFVENESNTEGKHENCEALAQPKAFPEISGLKNSNEDSKNEMQPNNYDSQNKSSVSSQSKKEENTTSTQSTENNALELLSQEDKVKLKIESIREKAEPFEDLIKEFTESSESNQYYYIEENLKRLVDQLDEMYDDINGNQILRMQRKEVYKILFKLFDDLDAKVEENMILFPKSS